MDEAGVEDVKYEDEEYERSKLEAEAELYRRSCGDIELRGTGNSE
jgi:hypothetical protein